MTDTTHAGHSVVAADVGGTFTDILVRHGSELYAVKLPSTPPAYGQAIASGLRQLEAAEQMRPDSIGAVLHGTTVATNTILEGTGAKVGLVTTAGFRDVLEIGRVRMPSGLNLRRLRPRPVVPRRDRFEIQERMSATGEVLLEVDPTSLDAVAADLENAPVAAVAVCLINSYVNPAHERLVADFLRDRLAVPVSASYELLSEIREYERTSTVVLNAYVRPVVERYVAELQGELDELGVKPRLQVMQSNGGLLDAATASVQPIRTVESGPAAGVIGAALVARELGYPNALSFDMGGTTAKAALIEDGVPTEVAQLEVGAGINDGHSNGVGFPIRLPSVDLVEVGAGGGSIVWLDDAGQPRVGPRSAGSRPGPVCYGRGGTQITVTDANLVLGYLNDRQLAGGSQSIDPAGANTALDAQIAKPLGLGTMEAAYGIYQIANANMGQALRAVSVERGRDPREHALIAFGGAGPMHAAAIAREFEIPLVVVPPRPGLFSAFGLLAAESRRDCVRPHSGGADTLQLAALFADMEREGVTQLRDEGYGADVIQVQRYFGCAYKGQQAEIRVPVGTGDVDDYLVRQAFSEFQKEYGRSYGHVEPEDQIHIVNVRVTVLGLSGRTGPEHLQSLASSIDDSQVNEDKRRAYFGNGIVETRVLTRCAVPTEPAVGPFIVDDMDSTIVIPPGCTVCRDEYNNLLIRMVY